jgi:predicted transcriptional regulator
MTTKEKMLNVISSLEDDASIDQAIYRLNLLRKIEIGQRQIEAGEFMEHEEFMEQLENENIQ